MHFMELKRFIIDDAVDFSHLFYLRGLRARAMHSDGLDESLKKWMDGTAVKPLAEVVIHLIDTAPGVAGICEFYPGVGLTIEYMKLLLARRQTSGEVARPYYTAIGPENARNKFEVLHADDMISTTYHAADRGIFASRNHAEVAWIYNHNQTIRDDCEPVVALDDFLQIVSGPAVICIRVSDTRGDHVHTSVKGREILLPAKERVITHCRTSERRWHFCYMNRFDADFFLPDPDAPTGLLIAYTGSDAEPLKGYRSIE